MMVRVRDEADNVQLKLRVKESLRAQLEQEATDRRITLNAAVVDRLEREIVQSEVLGGQAMRRILFATTTAFGHAGAQHARARGQSDDPTDWLRDPECYMRAMQQAVLVFAQNFPGGFKPEHQRQLNNWLGNRMQSQALSGFIDDESDPYAADTPAADAA
jgi:hypothetical protein